LYCLHLQILESGLQKANVPYSYGFAIILLTVLVKLATYPLSKKSVRAGSSCKWAGAGAGAGENLQVSSTNI
jgi:hypothetical protein